MSTAMPRPYEVPPTYPFARPRDEDYEEDNTQTINKVESLKRRLRERSKNGVRASYTILLIGETGAGKSSFVEFIANALVGRDFGDYDLDILSPTNEQGGPDNQSRTNSVHIYEFTRQNGTVVRILDTPGFPDTRRIEQSEPYEKNIATAIRVHIDSVTAVLIFINGTSPRSAASIYYALSTLSAIFPNTMVNNIALMLTNALDPFSLKISQDAVPEVLKNARQFMFDNPVALQKKHPGLRDDIKMNAMSASRVQVSEGNALEVVEDFFGWLDGLKSRPTKEIAVTSSPSLLPTLMAPLLAWLKPGDSESTADLESPRSQPLSFYQPNPVTRRSGVPIHPSTALSTSPLELAPNPALPSQALDTLSGSSLRTPPTQSPPLSAPLLISPEPVLSPLRSPALPPAPPGRATTRDSPLLKSLLRHPSLLTSSPLPASPSLIPDLELALDATIEPSTVLTTTFESSNACAAPEPATSSNQLVPDLELVPDATTEPPTVLTTIIESSDACVAPESATSPSLLMKLFVWLWVALAVSVPARLVTSTYQPVQGSLASPDSAQNRPQSIPTRNNLQTSLSQSPLSPTPNARPPPQPSMQSPPAPVLEMPRELFSDLTKPHNPKDFAITKFSKKLIEWVALDVVRIRNNHQVAYHIVGQCRNAYERINDIVDEIEQSNSASFTPPVSGGCIGVDLRRCTDAMCQLGAGGRTRNEPENRALVRISSIGLLPTY